MTCRCGVILHPGNDAPTCDTHAACVDCFDPGATDCPECMETYRHMLRDTDEQRRFEADRDARAER